MHNAEQGEWSSDTMDSLTRSKTPQATCRDREQCRWMSKHKFLFMISICSQQCNYSMKRQQFSCFISFGQKRWYSYEWKTTKLHNWPKLWRQLLVRWTTQYFSLYQDCRHIPAAFLSSTSRSKNQSNYFRKLRTLSDPVTTRSDKHACGKPWTSRRDEQGRSNARHSCLVTALHSESGGPGDTCARTFLWKRELRFGRWCFKSGDTKTEAQCSCSVPPKP